MNQGTPDKRSLAVHNFADRMLAFADAAIRYGADWIKDWRYADQHRKYLNELDTRGELEALLEVTGATREQLQKSEISPLAAIELLHRMMRQFGITPDEVDRQTLGLTEAEWACRLCKNWRQCRRWLDQDVVDDAYRNFCTNTALLDQLRTKHALNSTSKR